MSFFVFFLSLIFDIPFFFLLLFSSYLSAIPFVLSSLLSFLCVPGLSLVFFYAIFEDLSLAQELIGLIHSLSSLLLGGLRTLIGLFSVMLGLFLHALGFFSQSLHFVIKARVMFVVHFLIRLDVRDLLFKLPVNIS